MLRVWCLAMAVLIVPVAAWAELQRRRSTPTQGGCPWGRASDGATRGR